MTAVIVWFSGMLFIGVPLVVLFAVLGWVADALSDSYVADK